MDAITPKGHGQKEVDGHSHIVRPAEMEWQKTSFPGAEAKPLYFDPKTGIATLLMKFDPGAELPDHEHVLVEQTYVISGRLVDKEGAAEGLDRRARRVRLARARQPPCRLDAGRRPHDRDVPDPEQVLHRRRPVADQHGRDWDEIWGHIVSLRGG